MDPKALFDISCGIFILGAKSGGKINACVTNTCMQVASNPPRIAISVLNRNLTCSMIKESGTFSLSILDKSCTLDTISRFGYQSGNDVDKFSGFQYATDKNGNPYLLKQIKSMISGRVISETDLGTHTLFVAEVSDSIVFGSSDPMTYLDYQNDVKPKPSTASKKKIIAWKCKICGFEYRGEVLPADFICPICAHTAEDFEPVYEA